MRRGGLVCVLCGALAGASHVAGCSLTTSTDGLTGAKPGSQGGDAGAGDVGTAEAGDDAASAVEGGDGSAGGFCAALAPAPAFCADFDESDTSVAPWPNVVAVPAGAGSVVPDGAASASPPRSLLASVAAAASGPDRQAYVGTTLPGVTVATRVLLRFKLRIEATSVGKYWVAAEVKLTDGTGTYLVAYDLKSDGAAIEAPSGVTSALSMWPTPGRWIEIALEVRLDGTPHATVSMDGQLASTRNLSGLHGGFAEIRVGVVFVSTPNDAIAARFDDVVVEAQ